MVLERAYRWATSPICEKFNRILPNGKNEVQ